MSLYFGADTSNYTTSFALAGDFDKMVRELLPIADGERGIRQSDGVFCHIKNAPRLLEELAMGVDFGAVRAVGVSTRPRSVDGSYMPVFLTGEAVAASVATALGVPLHRFSHQDGHIMAGLLSAGRGDLLEKEFYSVHLSGGTFEILKSHYDGNIFPSEIVGGTKDISAGQLIDRVGVKCGIKFPCGREISRLAQEYRDSKIETKRDSKISLSVSEKNGYINLSGAETQAMRLSKDADMKELSYALIEVIGKSLIKALKSVGAKEVLLVGGVASSLPLKEYLNANSDIDFCFASAEMASDNAWGIAKLTQLREEGPIRNLKLQRSAR